MSVEWQIYTKTVATEDGGLATRWFWRKPVSNEGRERTEGFTTHAGFWRGALPERAGESPRGFTSRAECEADAAQHGYTPGKTGRHFSGSYMCRGQLLPFTYDGSWELRRGLVHWAATIRYLSSSCDARGTLFEERPAEMADAVRQSIEHWIEAFSCGRASSR